MFRAYTADWIFPGDTPPISGGAIVVRNGQIVSVEASRPAGVPLYTVEQSALLPALVNAHTHLEFSSLAAPLEPRDRFADWIRAVVNWRRSEPLQNEAIAQGLAEAESTGTGTLGEIATSDWIDREPALRPQPQHVVVFRELLGLRPEATAAQLEIARQHIQQPASTNVTRGLSPHAPYSVHPHLLIGLIQLAREHSAPVAMHLAETREELELLDSGTGPLVELLKDFGVWEPDFIPRGSGPLDYLRPLSEASRSLIVHGNYLSEDELDFLAQRPQMSVVYCPRTHAAMGHPSHPWRSMQERGINVCLGTDSRASNPDLSLWEELRHLQHLAPDLPASDILRCGTVNGAQALGLTKHCGRLAPGIPARMLIVPLSREALGNPEQHLLRDAAPEFSWVSGEHETETGG